MNQFLSLFPPTYFKNLTTYESEGTEEDDEADISTQFLQMEQKPAFVLTATL